MSKKHKTVVQIVIDAKKALHEVSIPASLDRDEIGARAVRLEGVIWELLEVIGESRGIDPEQVFCIADNGGKHYRVCAALVRDHPETAFRGG
jgi:hypothetical protein